MRDIVNAIFYWLRGGIAWRMLPPCFPLRQTVDGWFAAWRDAGLWQWITQHLVMEDRERVGREASPSTAVIDSQSVKTTEAGGPWPKSSSSRRGCRARSTVCMRAPEVTRLPRRRSVPSGAWCSN
jgi:hypothetical protein